MLTLERISSIGTLLYQFLRMFSDCFSRHAGRQPLRVYVQGQLSNIHRKNCESIALEFGKASRTLQRFLESSSGMKNCCVIGVQVAVCAFSLFWHNGGCKLTLGIVGLFQNGLDWVRQGWQLEKKSRRKSGH